MGQQIRPPNTCFGRVLLQFRASFPSFPLFKKWEPSVSPVKPAVLAGFVCPLSQSRPLCVSFPVLSPKEISHV